MEARAAAATPATPAQHFEAPREASPLRQPQRRPRSLPARSSYARAAAKAAPKAAQPIETLVVPERTAEREPTSQPAIEKKRFFTRGMVGLLALSGATITDIATNDGNFIAKPSLVGTFSLVNAGLQTDTGKAVVAYVGNEISRHLELDKHVAVEAERIPPSTLTEHKIKLLTTAIEVLHANNRGADITTLPLTLEKMTIEQVQQIRRQVFSVSTAETDTLSLELDTLVKDMTEHEAANDAVDAEEYQISVRKAQYEAEHLLTDPQTRVVTAAVTHARTAKRFAAANEELISNAAAGDNDAMASLGIQLIDKLNAAQIGRALLVVAKDRGSAEAATRLVAIERAEREAREEEQRRIAAVERLGYTASCTVVARQESRPTCIEVAPTIREGQKILIIFRQNGRPEVKFASTYMGATPIDTRYFTAQTLQSRPWLTVR
ncbi:MAG: hypothetical protein EBQ96_05330 [Proteobacteria bacterium]|nr:hypothetical protein [Pseudomonadota bacterium]